MNNNFAASQNCWIRCSYTPFHRIDESAIIRTPKQRFAGAETHRCAVSLKIDRKYENATQIPIFNQCHWYIWFGCDKSQKKMFNDVFGVE